MVVGLSEELAGHADARACWIQAGLAALNLPHYGRSILLRKARWDRMGHIVQRHGMSMKRLLWAMTASSMILASSLPARAYDSTAQQLSNAITAAA